MITVRKISSGIGVEKTYPVHSPKIERIELVKRNRSRQARPYFLRRLRRIR
jgi:large subunit ribosomal protein L19